ncbi:MAG TPA: hypothetical protein DHW82_05550 [Spirochaetia bacterium]|nr:MAG: hypothetical protein A2Y41_07505 [Spirochaetes bacterium GWB1_36_13]HCL56458.1 hypothetical protein [Spirochaetia bacterium]
MKNFLFIYWIIFFIIAFLQVYVFKRFYNNIYKDSPKGLFSIYLVFSVNTSLIALVQFLYLFTDLYIFAVFKYHFLQTILVPAVLFLYKFSRIPISKKKIVVISIVVGINVLLGILYFTLIHFQQNIFFKIGTHYLPRFIHHAILFSYVLDFVVRKKNRIENELVKKTFKVFGYILLISFPGFMIDSFFWDLLPSYFSFYLFFHSIWNSVLLFFYISNFIQTEKLSFLKKIGIFKILFQKNMILLLLISIPFLIFISIILIKINNSILDMKHQFYKEKTNLLSCIIQNEVQKKIIFLKTLIYIQPKNNPALIIHTIKSNLSSLTQESFIDSTQEFLVTDSKKQKLFSYPENIIFHDYHLKSTRHLEAFLEWDAVKSQSFLLLQIPFIYENNTYYVFTKIHSSDFFENLFTQYSSSITDKTFFITDQNAVISKSSLDLKKIEVLKAHISLMNDLYIQENKSSKDYFYIKQIPLIQSFVVIWVPETNLLDVFNFLKIIIIISSLVFLTLFIFTLLIFIKDFHSYQPLRVQDALKTFESLSAREKEIIHYVAQGLSNKEISKNLFITIHTVKKHLQNIFIKLQVKNKIQFLSSYQIYLHQDKL